MATEALTLDKDAFARMVTEEGLKTTRAGGYLYAGKHGKRGWELYRTFDDWATVPVSTAATANPAAAANPAAVTVPAGKRWLLLGMHFQLVSDANVATRRPVLIITDGTAQFTGASAIAGQTASLTADWVFAAGIYPNSTILAPAPLINTVGFQTEGIQLEAGYTFQIQITNIQAADDCTAVRYVYKEIDL